MRTNDLKNNSSPIGSREVVWATPDTRLEDALATMTAHQVHHLPVLEKGQLVGLLVDRDVLAAFITARSAGPGIGSWTLSESTAHAGPTGIGATSETLSVSSMGAEPSDYLIVGRYMRRDVLTIDESTDIREALNRMLESHVSALPVMSEGRLSGIVTETDMLRLLRDLLEQSDSSGDVVTRGEALLASPLVQNLVKTLGDIGL